MSQLDRDRAAVQQTRDILRSNPSIRKDLRELLWNLDHGTPVGLEGMQDEELHKKLQQLFLLLGLRCTKGQYWLPKGSPTALSVVSFVFEESLQPLPVPPAQQAPPAAQRPRSGGSPAAGGPAAGAGAAEEPDRCVRAQQPQQGAEGPPAGARAGEAQDGGAEAVPAAAPAAAAEEAAGQEPPGAPGSSGDGEGDAEGGADDRGGRGAAAPGGVSAEPPEPPRRRAVGPAMPPPEVLAAAAAYAAEVEAAGGYASDSDNGGELIGPPPPAYVDEADAAPADAREAEVLRVLRVLRAAAQQAAVAPAPKPAAAAAAQADPYDVLGVEHSAPAADIRKRYWRLSLLVHPDKCSAQGAAEAFQAVSAAAQLLQDEAGRRGVDAQREDAKLRRMAVEAAAQLERERAWRVARGEEPAGPPVTAAGMPAEREAWMTQLPAARKAPTGPVSQTSVRAFSANGIRERGDTSSWTDTPEQRQLRAQGLLTDGAGALMRALPGAVSGAEVAPSPVLAAAIAQFNSSERRQKSLLDQHLERKAKGKGGGKKSGNKDKQDKPDDTKAQAAVGKKPAVPAAEEWVGAHPWRPFDRDKDLGIARPAPKAQDLLKHATGLKDRFSGGR